MSIRDNGDTKSLVHQAWTEKLETLLDISRNVLNAIDDLLVLVDQNPIPPEIHLVKDELMDRVKVKMNNQSREFFRIFIKDHESSFSVKPVSEADSEAKFFASCIARIDELKVKLAEEIRLSQDCVQGEKLKQRLCHMKQAKLMEIKIWEMKFQLQQMINWNKTKIGKPERMEDFINSTYENFTQHHHKIIANLDLAQMMVDENCVLETATDLKQTFQQIVQENQSLCEKIAEQKAIVEDMLEYETNVSKIAEQSAKPTKPVKPSSPLLTSSLSIFGLQSDSTGDFWTNRKQQVFEQLRLRMCDISEAILFVEEFWRTFRVAESVMYLHKAKLAAKETCHRLFEFILLHWYTKSASKSASSTTENTTAASVMTKMSGRGHEEAIHCTMRQILAKIHRKKKEAMMGISQDSDDKDKDDDDKDPIKVFWRNRKRRMLMQKAENVKKRKSLGDESTAETPLTSYKYRFSEFLEFPEFLSKNFKSPLIDLKSSDLSKFESQDLKFSDLSKFKSQDINSSDQPKFKSKDLRTTDLSKFKSENLKSSDHSIFKLKDLKYSDYFKFKSSDLSKFKSQEIRSSDHSKFKSKDLKSSDLSKFKSKDLKSSDFHKFKSKTLKSLEHPKFKSKDLKSSDYSKNSSEDLKFFDQTELLSKKFKFSDHSKFSSKDSKFSDHSKSSSENVKFSDSTQFSSKEIKYLSESPEFLSRNSKASKILLETTRENSLFPPANSQYSSSNARNMNPLFSPSDSLFSPSNSMLMSNSMSTNSSFSSMLSSPFTSLSRNFIPHSSENSWFSQENAANSTDYLTNISSLASFYHQQQLQREAALKRQAEIEAYLNSSISDNQTNSTKSSPRLIRCSARLRESLNPSRKRLRIKVESEEEEEEEKEKSKVSKIEKKNEEKHSD